MNKEKENLYLDIISCYPVALGYGEISRYNDENYTLTKSLYVTQGKGLSSSQVSYYDYTSDCTKDLIKLIKNTIQHYQINAVWPSDDSEEGESIDSSTEEMGGFDIFIGFKRIVTLYPESDYQTNVAMTLNDVVDNIHCGFEYHKDF